ncbi:hypothetical protein, partial [Paenibacillus sp. 1_12]|uniref:hypothetical protein n=1 Tax=Paenibacillus sp. 1_12 TaxID=1566278 RepID=UPI001C480111
RKHGVPNTRYLRAQTHTLNTIGLHPLGRYNEGRQGHRPVEIWEGEPPRAVWRIRAVNGIMRKLLTDPLFTHAFMVDSVDHHL